MFCSCAKTGNRIDFKGKRASISNYRVRSIHYEKIKTQILKAAWVYQKTKAYIFKKTVYIWVSIALIAVAVMELAAKASVFMVVSLYSIVIIPIIIKKFKYEPAQGSMIISGLIRAAIWTVILIVMALLSRNNALIDKILFWPMVFD